MTTPSMFGILQRCFVAANYGDTPFNALLEADMATWFTHIVFENTHRRIVDYVLLEGCLSYPVEQMLVSIAQGAFNGASGTEFYIPGASSAYLDIPLGRVSNDLLLSCIKSSSVHGCKVLDILRGQGVLHYPPLPQLLLIGESQINVQCVISKLQTKRLRITRGHSCGDILYNIDARTIRALERHSSICPSSVP